MTGGLIPAYPECRQFLGSGGVTPAFQEVYEVSGQLSQTRCPHHHAGTAQAQNRIQAILGLARCDNVLDTFKTPEPHVYVPAHKVTA